MDEKKTFEAEFEAEFQKAQSLKGQFQALPREARQEIGEAMAKIARDAGDLIATDGVPSDGARLAMFLIGNAVGVALRAQATGAAEAAMEDLKRRGLSDGDDLNQIRVRGLLYYAEAVICGVNAGMNGDSPLVQTDSAAVPAGGVAFVSKGGSA